MPRSDRHVLLPLIESSARWRVSCLPRLNVLAGGYTFREQWDNNSKFDPARHRHRSKRKQCFSVSRKPPPEPQEDDDPSDPRFRRPSRASACSAHYRERYIMPEAIALLKAMTPIEAKEACLNVLKELGFTVILRLAPGKERDRTAETAKRSAKRAKIRAEKAALKAQALADQALLPEGCPAAQRSV